MNQFQKESKDRIFANKSDKKLLSASEDFMRNSIRMKYSYNFSMLGRPVIQYPQDIVAMQELIWEIKPDLIIETGIAHGGSLILSASMLALLDYSDAVYSGVSLDPKAMGRKVIGIDIDIRPHNFSAIKEHALAHKIEMIQGSSIAPDVIAQVHLLATHYERIMVVLDSNHTHDHVLAELEAYAPLVSKNSYCVVFDTVIENLPDDTYPERPWSVGNNPRSAVNEFLKQSDDFAVDEDIEAKLLISVAPGGYLRRR